MLLYIIYNSDLVDIAKGKNELTLAFVDDAAFIAIGKTFQETDAILTNMLECEGGVTNGRKTTIHILGCASMAPFCCAVTHPLLTDALMSSVLLYPFCIFDILLS